MNNVNLIFSKNYKKEIPKGWTLGKVIPAGAI